MPTAVVTGGASGLGLTLIERCAALGMEVAVLDLDGDRARSEARRNCRRVARRAALTNAIEYYFERWDGERDSLALHPVRD